MPVVGRSWKISYFFVKYISDYPLKVKMLEEAKKHSKIMATLFSAVTVEHIILFELSYSSAGIVLY